jgi:ankyrin repeat protein
MAPPPPLPRLAESDEMTEEEQLEWLQAQLKDNPELQAQLLEHLMEEQEADWDDTSEGGSLTRLLHASAEGEADTVRELLADKSLDVNAPGPDGDTALHAACLYGHEEVVQLLLEAGADAGVVNAIDGSSCLHDAAASGHLAILERLLTLPAAAALVNHADEDGDTPLHNAARGNHAAVVKALLQVGTVGAVQQLW